MFPHFPILQYYPLVLQNQAFRWMAGYIEQIDLSYYDLFGCLKLDLRNGHKLQTRQVVVILWKSFFFFIIIIITAISK